MSHGGELTLEQEFSLHLLSEQIKTLSREDSHQTLVQMYRQMMLRENYYRKSIR